MRERDRGAVAPSSSHSSLPQPFYVETITYTLLTPERRR